MKEEHKFDVTETLTEADLEALKTAVNNTSAEEVANRAKKYVLKNPVEVAGKRITELNIDFERLKGRDMRRIAAIPECIDEETKFREFSKNYYAYVVAAASDLTIHEFDELSFTDATAVTMLAQIFLMGAVSETTG